MSDFNDRAWKYAKVLADERYPLPKETPGMSAIKGGCCAFMLVCLFELLLKSHVPMWIASLITIAAASFVCWFDTRARYRNHSQFRADMYELRKDDPRYAD